MNNVVLKENGTSTDPDERHDFVGKLMQDILWARVSEYVEWQAAVTNALAKGDNPPLPPHGLSPISINLDPTTFCNYACPHCIDGIHLNKGSFEFSQLRDSLQLLIKRGLKSVILIGGGEPTVYRQFPELVKFLKGHGLSIGIVSNGSGGEMILKVASYLRTGDWVRYSLDNGNNNSFRAMHLPKSKRVTLDGICDKVREIRKVNAEFEFGFSFIIVCDGAEQRQENCVASVSSNINEIVSATRLARDSGFDYISLKIFLERNEEGAEVLDLGAIKDPEDTIQRIHTGITEAKQCETENFSVVLSTNLKALLEGTTVRLNEQPKVCHMTALRQVLSPLGIFNCPAHRGIQKARINSGIGYGTFKDADETRMRTAHNQYAFDASQECKEVTCFYNGANWFLQDLIERLARGEIDLAELAEMATDDRGDYFL